MRFDLNRLIVNKFEFNVFSFIEKTLALIVLRSGGYFLPNFSITPHIDLYKIIPKFRTWIGKLIF